ncbi:efflux RND transporter periplasmic adaptor subunit [Desulfomicrobium salsuginis]
MNASTPQHETGEASLKRLIETRSPARRGRRWFWLLAVLAALTAGGLLFLRNGKEAAGPGYKTEAAVVETLVVKVSATGNLQPTNQVDVGSELSGIIDQVLVDVNDRVEKGQVLARLDLSKLEDAVAKSRANLASAQAQVLQAGATVAQSRAELGRMRKVSALSGGKVPSASEMDTAEADLKRAEADEAKTKAVVLQTRADLQTDETNLRKASIRSPIDGVVLAREVDPGQTVAASFQAPVLFTLAEDLAKMELQVDVDEADVGQVREGQNATFTVDAWPGRRFDAVITKVSYGSQEKDGVISYLTELQVDNGDLSLRPGMTGTAEITTLVRENALLVPNAALRFTPPETGVERQKSGGSLVGALMPRPPRQAAPQAKAANGTAPKVWLLQDGRPVPVEVQTGATNGRMTEILGGALAAGAEVVTETVENAR